MFKILLQDIEIDHCLFDTVGKGLHNCRNILCALFVTSIIVLHFQGIMLVFDVTSESSFNNVNGWLENIYHVSCKTFI